MREAPNLERMVRGIRTIDRGSRPLPVSYVFHASMSDYWLWLIIDHLLYYIILTKPWMDNPRMLQSDWIHFMLLNQIFCHISSPCRMTVVGIAVWVESLLLKMVQAVASCSFPANANQYNWRSHSKRALRSFIIQCSCSLLLQNGHKFYATVSTLNYCQARRSKKLVLGHNNYYNE